jgi:hypothetical protein
MQFPLKAAILAACLLSMAPAYAQQESPAGPIPPSDATKQAQQDESERQLYVGMVAVRDYCKEAQPDRAKDFDSTWTKNTADVPAPIIEFSKSPNFAGMVTERIKSLHTGSTNPEYAAQLKATCEKLLQ